MACVLGVAGAGRGVGTDPSAHWSWGPAEETRAMGGRESSVCAWEALKHSLSPQ